MPQINTSVYGASDEWLTYYTGSLFARDNLPQYANFTGVSETSKPTFNSASALRAGAGTGRVQINVPIDNSFAMLGVDDNASIVHQHWYKRGNTTEESFNVAMQRYAVNPMGWGRVQSNYIAANNIVTIRADNDYAAWAYNQRDNLQSNPDSYFGVCTRMPMSIVYVIFVKVSDKAPDNDIPQSSINTKVLDLYTYINGHVANDDTSNKYYEDYPIILGILGYPMARNTSEYTDQAVGTVALRNTLPAANDIYPYPVILQQIEPFTDPDDRDQKLDLYRYAQPTAAVYGNTYSAAVNPYDDNTPKNGSTMTLDCYPFALFGGINYFISTPISSTTSYRYYYMGVCGHDDKLHKKFLTIDSKRYWAFWSTLDDFGGIDTFREYARRQMAYLGGFFTESYYAAQYEPTLDTDYCFCGSIDDDGVTHGNYTQGVNNRKQKQWDWDDYSPNDYDPNKKPDTGIYDDETQIVGNTSAGTAFVHVYECSYETIQNLKMYLYNQIAPEATQESLTKNFLTVNPIDCITGCYEFPFSVWDRFSHAANIVIGNTIATGGDEHPIVGYPVSATLRVLDFGSVYYYPYYDDFRDYEPYSEALLYIPYVGYIPISPSEYMGHDIGVKIIADITTGSCQALVYKDKLVIESQSGNIGTQVPITGIQQADYANAIHNASTALLSSQVASVATVGTAAISLATGNVVGAVQSVTALAQSGINISNAQYNLDHTKVPFKQSGVASPNINFSNEQQARLILKRPIMDQRYNQSAYGRTVGFACLITDKLSTFAGYTQATNVDMSGVTASADEKQMIQQLLQSGVYL